MSAIFIISSFFCSQTFPPTPNLLSVLICLPRDLSIFKEMLWVLFATFVFCSLYRSISSIMPLYLLFHFALFYWLHVAYNRFEQCRYSLSEIGKSTPVFYNPALFRQTQSPNQCVFWNLFSAYTFFYDFLKYIRHGPFSWCTHTHTHIY